MTVVSLDDRRARSAPAWNPDKPRHAWQDIDEGGHHHKCLHCWVAYHSEPSGSGYVKVWSHGARSGRSKSLGPCPGPSGRPVLTVVADAPAPEAVAAAPGEPVDTPACCRCVPPLPPCGQPTHLYLGGPMCDWQAGRSSGDVA